MQRRAGAAETSKRSEEVPKPRGTISVEPAQTFPIGKSGNVTGVMGISNPEILNNPMRLQKRTLVASGYSRYRKKILQDKRMAEFGNVPAGT